MVKPIPSAQDFLATLHGISEAEASERLSAEGPNELPTAKAHSFLAAVSHGLESSWSLFALRIRRCGES